jgi:hypothetical protein
MEETIEILSEKVSNSLSGWSSDDRVYMLRKIADCLTKMAGEILVAGDLTFNEEEYEDIA